MTNTFTYEFDELPLVVANGIPAALINGCAEIQYNRAGDWHIESVSVEGYQELTVEERARGVRPWIYVAAPDELADLIAGRLEGDWFGKVQDALNEQLSSDRVDALEARAEARRDDRMMGL